MHVDREVAKVDAPPVEGAHAGGRIVSVADGQIAAIAVLHGFAVATRDTNPFLATEVEAIDPWRKA